MRHTSFFLFSFLFIFSTAIAQKESDSLRVGYAGSAPFVIEGEEPDGVIIDIWDEIAFSLKQSFKYIEYPSIDSGIEAVLNNDIDVLIGPITINSSRANIISFSQPYFDTELAILAPLMEPTIWDRISPFISTTFLYAVIGLLVILSIVGFLFWLVEGRKSEQDYGKGPIRGIGSGVWLAVVTMTTVGYGDYAPRTAAGRFIMGSWMVISLILATSFVAGIATTFSMSTNDDKTIIGLNQIEGKRVAIPNYKNIADRVRDFHGIPVMVDDVSEAYQLLMNQKVDAVLYDEVPLEYIFENNKKKDFVLSKKRIEPQYYGFVFEKENDFKHQVDLEIIHLREIQRISRIISDWVNRT
jgi:polar amino acid transport system substrate-binding protein